MMWLKRFLDQFGTHIHTHTLTSELVALCQLHGLFFFVLFYLFIFLVIVCLSYQSMIVEVSL